MKEMGVFGLVVPARWDGSDVSARCFALVTAELARGWMSLAGAMGGHSVVARLLTVHGTPEQRERWLPRMATGEVRAAMALTEPSGDRTCRTSAPAPSGTGTPTSSTAARRGSPTPGTPA
ncbi:acyl-CoA dehydrogenase family protein [Blastococcus brunescens]|uniref:Acyl-CoA dehydrogenase family protein n=1 Tax=Blastococcus brunescens TaxID=1564165 RepID=A0ABZ1B0V3_9ACTN|nr:acyl-CoA dehydrogenase family protein [Blastococcus sp. BMG 8361]WRL64415.1 acyl-CoA dehydrogenase family protein [Blastococcus sp. BMG 8361]